MFSSRIATVFRNEIDDNLPISSTLGKKSSDVVGDINFIPNNNFKIDYNYSIDNG